MKHLKKKLIAATAMLMVSAMMLTSVSYAWFTLSTNPEMSGMKATVVANENLEIALDNGYSAGENAETSGTVDFASKNNTVGGVGGSTTGNPYTWGNELDLATAFATEPTLQPVKFTNNSGTVKLEYPKYGDDGRLSALADLKANNISDHSSITGDALKGGVKAYSVAEGAAPYYAFSVDFWLRSNEAGKVTLLSAAGTERADDEKEVTGSVNEETDAVGEGSYIRIATTNNSTELAKYMKHMKIAFVQGGTTVYAKIADTATTEEPYTVWRLSNETGASVAELEANVGEKVTMYVYIDGATITNADAILTDVTGLEFNIQFAHSAITSATTDGSGAMTGNK